MQYLWKRLLIILFLISVFSNQALATEINNTKLLILDILTSKNITIVNSTHDPTSFRKVDRHIQIDIIENRRKVYDV